ncbi:MAG: peptidoglycan editing factor PgeF [Pelistega sp.]|nr:peptidoglycan editing factor PgeF [Pelistega sp.]
MQLEELVTGKAWKNVRYGTTTRHMSGGVSVAPFDSFNLGLHCGDNAEHAQANRDSLTAILPSRPLWLNQVHGTDVLNADEFFTYPATADAAITTQVGRVLAIMTADCLPVVVADTEGKIIGAAHAGWRGLQAGVLERMVGQMKEQFPQASFQAWVGPAISQAVFEVGAEVYAAFTDSDEALKDFFKSHIAGKYLADLAGIAKYKLEHSGVAAVELSGECTYLQEDKYFSYRKGQPTGRIVTIAYIENS